MPNTLPDCTACATGKASEVGSTEASHCLDNPLLQAEKERNAAQERKNLITILSAIVVVLLMVLGGAWRSYFHRTNLALTKQLNEGLLTQVAEQHEEMVYLRNWR